MFDQSSMVQVRRCCVNYRLGNPFEECSACQLREASYIFYTNQLSLNITLG